MADLGWHDGSSVVPAPRSILRVPNSTGSPQRGMGAVAATELEFMVFDDTYRDAWSKSDYQST